MNSESIIVFRVLPNSKRAILDEEAEHARCSGTSIDPYNKWCILIFMLEKPVKDVALIFFGSYSEGACVLALVEVAVSIWEIGDVDGVFVLSAVGGLTK